MNYNQLIENAVISQVDIATGQTQALNELIKYVGSIIPRKLYRFRAINENSLSALYNDELYFSKGSSMNDDFDARLYYDRKKIEKWIDSFISDEGGLKIVDDLFVNSSIPDEINRIFPNAQVVIDSLKRMPKQQVTEISQNLIKYIKDNIDVELNKDTKILMDSTKFACFSERIHSDMMWGHYANNATGFAIEYEFGNQSTITYDLNGKGVIWGNLFPIMYGNCRLNTTTYAIYLLQVSLINRLAHEKGIMLPQQLINRIVPCPDVFMATKIAIKKSNDWKSEKEWRLFFTTNDTSIQLEEHPHVIQKASAVYLGRKISKINEKIIVDIAREKRIPVYKMNISNASKVYRLGKERIYKP